MAVEKIQSKYAGWTAEPTTVYPEEQGILSVESDPLLYDPLKYDPLATEVDLQSEAASNRVASYYEDLGLALLPEDALAFNLNSASYKEADATALGILKDYQTQFNSDISEYDKNVEEAISAAEAEIAAGAAGISAPDSGFVTVRVTNGDTVEASYQVPQATADALAAQEGLYTLQTPEGFNVDVRAEGGTIIGDELHTALADAEQQSNDMYNELSGIAVDSALDAYYTVNNQALENAINEANTQRNIAVQAFDQEFEQGLQMYEQIGQQWGDYFNGLTTDQETAKSNTSESISNLLSGGMLSYSLAGVS